MTRYGTEITEARLANTLNVGIERSNELLLWEAAIAAGATLDDLEKLDNREYSKRFMARLVVWYERHQLYKAHVSDAEAQYIKKKSKK